ncbi:plantaricin C family lantibiotic [Clostridium folliculivorans]|uniref:Plantaricin C family lantibiotic n=1 Tax=Clostridium folliculivorans TaxID=2886038 RepID=A0A9W5Y4P4_9CLOT|nr:plantaricin C family lantibiotic [Clostridium folliculivorans]GKU26676.1 hypothetical protein CFOLD11_35030 [Clostridium folliculivorans]GKU28892.1 hypothetical protein CFB3_09980 [Clostridium folliculivorans]
MIKDPIRRYQESSTELPCGDVNYEISENQGLDVTGGTFSGGTISITLSVYMGNKGSVCTWTIECQSNCSK